MRLNKLLLAAGFVVACVGGAIAAPYPRASMPSAIDLGAAQNIAGENQITATVSLKLRNSGQLESLLQALYEKGNPQYRHFLSTREFADRFGPGAATIAQVTHHFQAAGFTVTESATAQLKVTGSAAAMQREFAVQLHGYEVPASADAPAYRYHAPLGPLQVSAVIADSVESVLGLDTRARYYPHAVYGTPMHAVPATVPAKNGAPNATNTPDPPGLWTVTDFTQYYDVDPLYLKGVNGRTQTIGIMTFASLTPSDVFAYWSALGLNVSSSRLTQVSVGGGSGPPSDASGSDETTLDVEQSGGIAPGAQILVYEAPNTNAGLVEVFAAAIDKNVAQTLSLSWGSWEFSDTFKILNPVTGKIGTALQALNSLLMQAAAQGQSVITSSGDDGAYLANDPRLFPVGPFTKVLSVDDPAVQPYITAAGGTTLPGKQVYLLNPTTGQTLTISVATEQVWGWDYLEPLCSALGAPSPINCGTFPAGGGGGVSIEFPVPSYQAGIAGIALSQPGQILLDETQSPPQVVAKLPGNFAGRNIPDVSLNSDPQTGYLLYYTSDTGFVPFISSGWGGTSFAAPQLNGVTALMDQAAGHRLGFLNPALYGLLRSNTAYAGKTAPLRDIVHGDNWFYFGATGYDQGTGVGVPNVANLLTALEAP